MSTNVPLLPSASLHGGDEESSRVLFPPFITAVRNKCSKRGCSEEGVTGLCKADGCNKWIHYTCYVSFVLKKNNLQPLLSTDGSEFVLCTKVCHNKIHKQLTSTRLLWDKDGKNGSDDPIISESILLTWLMTGQLLSLSWQKRQRSEKVLVLSGYRCHDQSSRCQKGT
jgi:hypothetical protein